MMERSSDMDMTASSPYSIYNYLLQPNHVGIYRLKMKLKDVIDQKIRFVEEIAKERCVFI